MDDFKEKETSHCGFCGASGKEIPMVLKGRIGKYLCARCVGNIVHMFPKEEIEDKKKDMPKSKGITMTPRQIKIFLDDYIIGQEEAKEALSVAVFQHYQRIYPKEVTKKAIYNKVDKALLDVEIEKSNVLIIGPTGVGKTLLAKTIAQMLSVPFAIADATVFTEAGYVGEDVESVLSRLLQACNYEVAQAECGIVYIDEIDKLARKGMANPSISKDVGGEGVQQGLLKLLEGTEVLVPPQGGRKHPDQKMIKINTQHILFICGGAFEGIDKIIARRMNTQTIGFRKEGATKMEEARWTRYVNTQDLRFYGIIPELLGRLPVISYLDPLDKEALVNILKIPKNALLKQYEKMFALQGIHLHFEEEAIVAIADTALRLATGARGLRSICERILRKAIFSMGDKKKKDILTITKAYVDDQLANYY